MYTYTRMFEDLGIHLLFAIDILEDGLDIFSIIRFNFAKFISNNNRVYRAFT